MSDLRRMFPNISPTLPPDPNARPPAHELAAILMMEDRLFRAMQTAASIIGRKRTMQAVLVKLGAMKGWE